MRHLHRFVMAALGAAFFVASAQAQNAGTVSNHAVPIGKGPGVQGFGSLALTSGQVIIGQSNADPQAKTLTGDVTVDNTGTTAIGANKVTNSQLATMPANTTKCNATAGVANPTDCIASTMRTNLGLVIGTNVQAWDADLDCIAALSSTGVISRTGAGTCSAGALALSGLATGTQDTVVGYFGSTTASATSVPNCTGALTYSTSTHTFGCGSGGTATPVLASRAVAAAQDLSAFSAVRTLGYAAAGDGGGATFVKTSGNFRDSYTTGASVTANGGTCTNGTYLGVYVSGGNGVNFQGNITVSGGNATLTKILDYGGNGYSINDVLTVQAGFVTGCQPQITVSAVSTALASFTDLVGNKWQYIPDGFVNPLAFGCKFNYTRSGGDAGATSDTPCVRDTLAFASYSSPDNQNTTVQQSASNRVLFPAGTALLSGTDTPPGTLLGTGIVQPTGVIVEGAGPTNTIFKVPQTGIAQNFWNLCDQNRQKACFGTAIRDVGLTALTSATRTASLYLLYSNSVQQLEAVRNVQIYDGPYGCYRYDNGYGGAATVTYYNVFCTHQNNNQDAMVINSSTTIHQFQTLICEGSSTANCVDWFNGHGHIIGFHNEGVAVGINVNSPSSTSSLTVSQATGGNGCTSLVTLQSTNSPGNFAIYDAYKNGCSTNLVANGQSGGSNRTVDTIPAGGWLSFNP